MKAPCSFRCRKPCVALRNWRKKSDCFEGQKCFSARWSVSGSVTRMICVKQWRLCLYRKKSPFHFYTHHLLPEKVLLASCRWHQKPGNVHQCMTQKKYFKPQDSELSHECFFGLLNEGSYRGYAAWALKVLFRKWLTLARDLLKNNICIDVRMCLICNHTSAHNTLLRMSNFSNTNRIRIVGIKYQIEYRIVKRRRIHLQQEYLFWCNETLRLYQLVKKS